jgi:uncharacterized OB-fold protein
MTGAVYTETVIHAAPPQFAGEAPYQLIIVSLDDGHRVTGRVEGERVAVDDRVGLAHMRNGVPFFQKL